MKDWIGNSVAYVTTAGFANNRIHDRQKHDFYATEPKATELLLTLDTFSNVWECACGGGDMAEVLRKHNILSFASDKYYSGYGVEQDFLTTQNKWHGDIITNPPYKYANEFIKKALDLLEDGHKLALFMPCRYLAGKARKKSFTEYPPYKVWVSSSRLICAINGDFDSVKESAVDYAWFIWHKGYSGETKLGWFN